MAVAGGCSSSGGSVDAGADGAIDDGGTDGGGDGGVRDGGGDDLFDMPPPEAILPPEVYDCRAVDSPPERSSSLPLGCYADPDCEGLVVVAHRGSSYFAPENTLSALRSAIALGTDMVEIDTRLTADGEVVLLHDSSVERTTMGTGEIEELTLAEVRALPLVVAERLSATADFGCERVPTLREALELCRGRIDIMLDLKQGPAEAAMVVEAEGLLEQAVFLGSRGELDAVRSAVPEARLMVRPDEHAEVQPLWEAYDPRPVVIHIDPSFDDEATIGLIHDLGANALIDMWGADVQAAVLRDYSDYLEEYDRGIDIQQSEWPFFALWSVGRAEPPTW